MVYHTVTIPITLSDIQGHAPKAGFLNVIFSYSYAAVYNM